MMEHCNSHWSLIFLLLLYTIKSSYTESDVCTEMFMDYDLIKYRAKTVGISKIGYILSNEIRLLTEYQFNCSSTTITSVILGGDLRISNNNHQLFPVVQIWRPIYNRPNQYYLIPDSERTIYYSTNNVSTNGVFEYPLDPPIPVQSGDILAISQPPQENSTFRVYYIQNVINFDSYAVSFGSIHHKLSGTPINSDLVLVYPITDEACVSSSINATVIKVYTPQIHETILATDRRQYIYPEMKFSCNGSITKWIYGAVDQNRSTGDLPELQIWHQTGPNSYNKQGSSLVTANISIAPNVYEYYPVTPLEFQEGDIFGVHIPDDNNSQLWLYEQRESGPLNLYVNSEVNSPAPSTINGTLTTDEANNYPLVTVIISISTEIVSTTISSTIETSSMATTDSPTPSTTLVTSDLITKTSNNVTVLISTNIPLTSLPTLSSTVSTSSILSFVSLFTSSSLPTLSSTVTVVFSSSPSNSMASTDISTEIKSLTIISSTSYSLTSDIASLLISYEFISTTDNILSSFTTTSINLISSSSSTSSVPSFVSLSTSSSLPTLSSTVTVVLSSSPSILGDDSPLIIPIIFGVVCFIIVLLTITLIIITVMFVCQRRQKRKMNISSSKDGIELTMTNQLYSQHKPPERTLINPIYTDTANIKNDKKINDEYEDIYDNDDKCDNNILTHSSPAYEFVECEESTSETRQTSDSISGMMPNFVYDIYNKDISPEPSLSTDYDDTLQTSVFLTVPSLDERAQLVDNNGYTNNDGRSVYDKLIHIQKLSPQCTDVRFSNYWEPGSDINNIYQQLSSNKYREILPQQIEITGELGSGQFGTVAKGKWQSMDVAIKTLKDDASEEEKVKFLQEAAIMGQFHHPNIVKLYGVVTVGEPTMIILELVSNGDLREYLQKFQPLTGELIPTTISTLLLSFCRQIASGMEYLSKKCFVHRDLAARNILVTEQDICKIADFGMSRDLQDENYYISHAKKIPIKWTAPEALHFKRYSTASDVWSFGVVLYEIWSLGHKPFENRSNQECMRLIDSGYRLRPPPGCPRPIYKMMIQCWHPETSSRPTFVRLVSDLSQADVELLSSPLSNEDKTYSPESPVVGSPLDTAHNLYIDI